LIKECPDITTFIRQVLRAVFDRAMGSLLTANEGATHSDNLSTWATTDHVASTPATGQSSVQIHPERELTLMM
jgi:hypothetical protein